MASGLLDLLTGGETSASEQDLEKALQAIEAVPVPTAQQLTLPQLQQYVQAGVITPAQAQAYLQQSNALATENVPQTGNAAMVQALNELSDISDAGPMGTPVEQAQIAQDIEQMNHAVQGQRGAIEQQMEAKGTPAAMIQAALENQYVGQDAEQAYQNSLAAQAAAYQAAVQALSEKAGVGNTLQQGVNTQANTVAAAQNAMQQFNAANQQQAGEANAQRIQEANAANAQNAQAVSNANVQENNARTAYNANLPQTVFQDQMQKAGAQAGVNESQSNQATAAGQQEAGLIGGLIGAGATVGGNYALGSAMAPQTTSSVAGQGYQYGPPAGVNTAQYQPLAHGGVVGHEGCYHDGGICMEEGGMVPGMPEVPGDSLKNDKIHIMASPGEAVIPRTAVQAHMPEVLSLLAHGDGHTESVAHPSDIATVLKALRALRMGVA